MNQSLDCSVLGDENVLPGEEYPYSVSVSGGEGELQYHWSGTEEEPEEDDTATAVAPKTGSKTITCTVTDENSLNGSGDLVMTAFAVTGVSVSGDRILRNRDDNVVISATCSPVMPDGKVEWQRKCGDSAYTTIGDQAQDVTLVSSESCGRYRYRARALGSDAEWQHETGDLYVYAIPVEPEQTFEQLLYYGFKVKVTWESSSGSLSDLEECECKEVVETVLQERPFENVTPREPLPPFAMNGGSARDTHWVSSVTHPYCDGAMLRNQRYVYRCKILPGNDWQQLDTAAIERRVHDKDPDPAEDWYLKTSKECNSGAQIQKDQRIIQ